MLDIIHGTSPRSAFNIARCGFSVSEDSFGAYFFNYNSIGNPNSENNLGEAVYTHGGDKAQLVGARQMVGLVMAKISEDLTFDFCDARHNRTLVVEPGKIGGIAIEAIRFYDLGSDDLEPVVCMEVDKGVITCNNDRIDNWSTCLGVIKNS